MEVEYPTVVPFAFFVNPSVTGVTNLTRTQALNIYSGSITTWDQVAGYTGTPGKKIVKCLRHAGSGTHSTLDMAVFRDDAGHPASSLMQYEDTEVFFNFSSSDMKKCIELNGGKTDGYAVGYMDADQENSAPTKYRMLSYQGAKPYANEIKTGAYDFWSKQNIYMKSDEKTTYMTSMIEFAKTHVPSNKSTWWVATEDLQVTKDSDNNIPSN
jgi:ABC-type phosphate transport system substrate-binding protein